MAAGALTVLLPNACVVALPLIAPVLLSVVVGQQQEVSQAVLSHCSASRLSVFLSASLFFGWLGFFF